METVQIKSGGFMRKNGKALILALALAALATLIGFGAAPAFAVAHCFCKAIENVGNTAGTSIPNPLIDFGQLATYNTAIGHNSDCENKCSQAASNSANFNNKTWWCQLLKVKGHHRVSAYAAVGANGIYRVTQSIEFDCTGGDTTCTCPKGWVCNGCSPQVDGGITIDGKCKKLACQPDVISPPPADGTQIGNPSWGFSWGNAFYAWGTTANGGAPNCVTTPWEGH
ncbi:MAG TPA: hypothetical protein VHC97_00790 [Thermoanaerobaculia bacterium]|jgi:hypothetical protein|nr:hypothetical protein [Thermoanaerobaculia bacterium]